ncbi:hypothetical protein [Pseudomonas aeruginosa]|uniref:hypothetical protein n=1 Tax=Pseudomonas aeruginosa TaxID=287 RepID=UPI002935F54D|nr:hypothetical protein [Pseudomonas aeruginosa]MDV2663321.1 hypothetical protein [Pseudomonas aeruginosa]HBO5882601.1 hypothetical protein [Pseudomonas aeruginosa]HBP4227535.1 hypothetical protein [Pseudomonas aeruginosa]HBP4649601.1 hypothetical protein [Pseudomonas aeruginosa]HBP4751567.1 hypothetical protein [Pseudomonas aeruginosa]
MNIDELLSNPFSFNKRKIFTPCETRPLWKCSLVVLIVGITGKEKRCSLKKIHTANWLTKSPAHFDDLVLWSQKNLLFAPGIRLDPTVDRAIELLAGSGFVCKIGGKIALTAKGELFLSQLESDAELMKLEKQCLSSSKKYLSEAAVERLFKAD